MDPSRFDFARPFVLAAGPTAPGCCPDVALRFFIPPLLLSCSPYFRFAAILATKRSILVVAALGKIGDAIAVCRSQSGRRHDHDSDRVIDRPGIGVAGLARGALGATGLDFLTTLLVAFHWAQPFSIPANKRSRVNFPVIAVTCDYLW
jgi:hypothetical protein